MTDQQKERAQKFFQLLHDHGITSGLVVSPPENADIHVQIHKNGDLSAIDKASKKRSKIKMI